MASAPALQQPGASAPREAKVAGPGGQDRAKRRGLILRRTCFLMTAHQRRRRGRPSPSPSRLRPNGPSTPGSGTAGPPRTPGLSACWPAFAAGGGSSCRSFGDADQRPAQSPCMGTGQAAGLLFATVADLCLLNRTDCRFHVNSSQRKPQRIQFLKNLCKTTSQVRLAGRRQFLANWRSFAFRRSYRSQLSILPPSMLHNRLPMTRLPG